jgi:hypothetical protein
MKKTILFIFAFALVNFSFAQNKKKQIRLLNNRLDSLKIAFQNESSIKNNEIDKLVNTTKDLEIQKVNLQNNAAFLNATISDLKRNNSLLKDSLNSSLNNIIKLDSTYKSSLQKMFESNAKLDSNNKVLLQRMVALKSILDSKNKINSPEFESFLPYFLSQTFSGMNFDSLVYFSSPIITQFIESNYIGFGRFWNLGAMCNLYVDDHFGSPYFENEIQPNTARLKYFPNKVPKDGFCDEATTPDGIYYKQVFELPQIFMYSDPKKIPTPSKYNNLKKMVVNIQYDKWIIKILYFIQYNSKWYLLYIDDCDCSA